ncbi:MAG: zinc ribbon domain-containing protein [Anaerolineae bacterium]|nr:zinc ribbon domain-containing protein [Anaerolineae bacterium]
MTDTTVRCPHCGAELAPGNRFCTACGGDVPALPWPEETPAAAAPAALWPRRLAVLIAVSAVAIVCLSTTCIAFTILALYLASG